MGKEISFVDLGMGQKRLAVRRVSFFVSGMGEFQGG